MQTPRSAGPARYVLAATLLVIAGAVSAAVLLGRGAGRDGRADVSRALSGLLERCAGARACLELETANLVAAAGPVSVANAAIETYREHPRAVPACHTYLHLLGAHLTARVSSGDAPALGATWTECGAGLVHGAFENITFDPADLADVARIVTLCDGTEFAAPTMRRHACLHAVGHGIHTAVGGDLARGEELCLRAMPDEASFSKNHPCLAGVYMVDRDERIALLPAPVDVRGWAELLAHCTSSPRPEVCTGSYFETATRHGTTEALSYLDWCLSASEETTCLLLLGQGATFRQLLDAPTDPGAGGLDATTCLLAAADRGLDPAPCIEGTRQALAATGVAPDGLTTQTCLLLAARGHACPSPGNDQAGTEPGARHADGA